MINPLSVITNKVGPRVGLAGLAIKNISPEIYLAAGLVAGVASAIMFAKAHKKSEETFQVVAEEIKYIQTYDESEEELNQVVMDPNEKRMALASLYKDTAVLTVKLYGPSVLMGCASVGLLLASHGVLRDRNKALLGVVALLERGFATYRERVVEELGTEADERFYFGAESRGVVTLESGEEGGKLTKKKGQKNYIPEKVSPMIYSRTFDRTNRNWSNDPEMTEYYLRSVQSQMEDKFYLQGWLLLNTVYDALGFEETPEGAVVGWSKNLPGDGCVLFGLDNDINQREGDDRWILDFNVQGVVYTEIGLRKNDR
jgi:hypothetical protein